MELLETEHIAAVGATGALSALAVWAARKLPGAWVIAASRGLALLIPAAYAATSGRWTPGGEQLHLG